MDVPSTQIPVLLYSGLNILALAAFTADKLGAKTGTIRSPESLLLFLAALGPFGAIIAMVLFRHKTRHLKFLLVPVFLIVHIVILFQLQNLLS